MKENTEFSIKTLWQVFVAFWLVISIITVAAGAIGGIYASAYKKPTYIAEASFWVKSASGGVNQSQTMGAAQMASNYIELMGESILLIRAVKSGALDTKWNCTEDEAVATLKGMLSAGKSSEDSFVFTVYVSSKSQEMTYDGILAVQSAVLTVVAEVNGVSEGEVGQYLARIGEVYSERDIRVARSSPVKYAVLFAALGFVGSYVVCFLLYIFDNKARRKEQLLELGTAVVALPDLFYDEKKADELSPEVVTYNYLTAGGMVRSAMDTEEGVVAITSASYANPEAALSVAESYLASGKRVLLVECDMSSPMLAELAEIDTEGVIGLDKFISEGTIPTVVGVDEGFDVIVAGEQREDGYISVNRLRELVSLCRADFDVVILALPAANLLLDLVDIPTLTDRCVLVANSGESVSRISDARDLLDGLGAEVRVIYFLPA